MGYGSITFYRIIFILAIFVHQPEAEGNYFAVRLVLADDVYRFLMLMIGVGIYLVDF